MLQSEGTPASHVEATEPGPGHTEVTVIQLFDIFKRQMRFCEISGPHQATIIGESAKSLMPRQLFSWLRTRL